MEEYFRGGTAGSSLGVRGTSLPPLYFQTPSMHPPTSQRMTIAVSRTDLVVFPTGHSMTIVGIEKLRNGGANLLVFDPRYHDVERVSRALERDFGAGDGGDFLKLYRRDLSYLRRYSEFELLE